MADMLDFFPDKVVPEPNSGCWIWTGAINVRGGGYGSITTNKPYRKKKTWLAHRYSWFLYHADPGLALVCHKCDNRLCVNHDHLFLGSRSDNMVDCLKKNRHPSRFLRGEKNNSKLSERDAMLIREAEGNHSAIGRKFKVSRTVVRKIKNRQMWKHV